MEYEGDFILLYVKRVNREYTLIDIDKSLFWQTRSDMFGLGYTCPKDNFDSIEDFIAGCSPYI